MPHEKLVCWGKYDIENLSRLRRNIEVDDTSCMHRMVLNIHLLKLISFHAHSEIGTAVVFGFRNHFQLYVCGYFCKKEKKIS